MYYIISGDFDNISVEVVKDPGVVEKRYSWIWSHAEFAVLTGITLPGDLYALSIEPARNIYAFKLEGDEKATAFEDLGDSPQWMQDIVAKAGELRQHTKAYMIEQRRVNRGVKMYEYDPGTDQIVESDHPDKDHNLGKRYIFDNRFADRMLPLLIDILLAKGVLVDADLPAAYHNKIDKIKQALAAIDWSK